MFAVFCPFAKQFCVPKAKDRLEREIRAKGERSMATKRSRKTSKRTVIQPRRGDRRYVRRNKTGQFKKEVNVGRSLAADRRRKAKTKVAKGQGDRGDAKRSGNVVRRLVRTLTRS